MSQNKRIRDYGIIIGKMSTGERNCLTDVPGVGVGHVTLSAGDLQTGVTAVLPHRGNLFRQKVMGAVEVINGFGKSIGLMQVEELGTIETPLILTNTLNVGIAADGLVAFMLDENPEIGLSTGTVNPLVFECNDGYLNRIRERRVTEAHVRDAIRKATQTREVVLEGAVGAGTGMSAYHFKGGIGTASRKMELDKSYVLGALVLANFGKRKDLMIQGQQVGIRVTELEAQDSMHCEVEGPEKGSVIVILGTDLPLSERQLKRIARRAVIGLSRTGSYLGNGSGDVVLAFSTANQTLHFQQEYFANWQILQEDKMDIPFRAVAEAVEEAVLNSMVATETVTGRDQHKRVSLADYLGRAFQSTTGQTVKEWPASGGDQR